MSNQDHITFKRLDLLNGTSYNILHETHIYSKSYLIQITPITFDLSGMDRSNEGHWAGYHGQCIIIQWSCQAERPLVFLINVVFAVWTYPFSTLMHHCLGLG